MKESLSLHKDIIQSLVGGMEMLSKIFPSISTDCEFGGKRKLKELTEKLNVLKTERLVIESEFKNINPNMKNIFLEAAVKGNLDVPRISDQCLEETFGPLHDQVYLLNVN